MFWKGQAIDTRARSLKIKVCYDLKKDLYQAHAHPVEDEIYLTSLVMGI